MKQLHAHHWLTRFIAHHLILPYGSDAIEPLQHLVETGRPELQQTALWLLRSIGVETATRLGSTAATLICPTCVTHCSRRSIPFSQYPAVVYYGCRACGQSLSFEPRPERIVAVLDERRSGRPTLSGSIGYSMVACLTLMASR